MSPPETTGNSQDKSNPVTVSGLQKTVKKVVVSLRDDQK